MTDKDKVFDAIRNCITEPKCRNCPWKECEKIGHKRVTVPVTLMLDALALLKEQQETVTSFQGTINRLNNALQEQPAQKRGRWIQVESGFTDMKCSECGELALLDLDRDFVQSRFCPNCGAKMEEERDAEKRTHD